MQLSGAVVPMATPITTGREVDIKTLETFTDSLVDAGIHGLFPGSSIGEFPSLTREQNRAIVETVVDTAADRTTVLAGCCDTNVEDVVDHIDVAADCGADAGVVVTPYYLRTTQGGLERFFVRVADRADLPLLLYNIPALTGNRLAVETVRRLAGHPQIAGVKDTSGDLTYHHRIIAETPAEFLVFQGATQLAAASLDLGADGLIAGPANVFPRAMCRLYRAHAENEREEVSGLMREVVAPLIGAIEDVPTAAGIKHLIGYGGLDVGGPLSPLPPLADAKRDRLERTFDGVADRVEAPTPGR